jgi:hypothetical protein
LRHVPKYVTHDFHARARRPFESIGVSLDPVVGQFHVVDPLSEEVCPRV